MIREGKFGVQEAVSLATIAVSAKLFFSGPSLTARLTGTAGWYQTLISAATAMIGFAVICLLLKRYPNKDIIAVFHMVLGRPVGFVCSGLLALWLLFTAAFGIREFADVMKVYALPLSPPSYIIAIFIATALILNLLGLESLARFSRLLAPVLLLFFITVLALGMQNYDFHNIFPIWGYGLGNTVLQGITGCSEYGEIVVLAIFAGSLQGIRHLRKAGYLSIAISGIVTAGGLLAFIMTFPYYLASETAAPMYQLATLIDFGRFLQRIDPIFLFVWIITAFISRSILFYAFASVYCKMFRIQDIRPVLTASAIILFALAMIPQDMMAVLQFIQLIRNCGWTVLFLLPLITLLVAGLRDKRGIPGA
jgi:spore germination protein KB